MLYEYIWNKVKKVYDIPTVIQVGDYNYAKNLSCSCADLDSYIKKLKKWHCDGIYDSNIGMMICFTCHNCNEKFYFHIKNNWDDYAELGVFNEYLVESITLDY